jgi:hypothetical protein
MAPEHQIEGMLDAGQACQYLTKLWGLEEPYTVPAFKKYRLRNKIEPDFAASNNSYWTIETLNTIPRPVRGRPPVRREDEENTTPLDPPPGPGHMLELSIAS